MIGSVSINVLTPDAPPWLGVLSTRLHGENPRNIFYIGNIELLDGPKTALFCSERCPGNEILGAYDAARRLRDSSKTVISGFHSLVEKECLRILLRGRQPIIFCPARALDRMRVPKDLRPALESGRLLILAPFEYKPRRPTAGSAARRNQLVAALADEALIIHSEPGGEVERVQRLLKNWGVPILQDTKSRLSG